MTVQENVAAVCPDCGTRMETTTSGDLGMHGLLAARGPDDAQESENKDDAFARCRINLGHTRSARHEDGSPWELGRGAMGVTYRAIDTSLQRSVALKIIKTDLGSRSALRARERFILCEGVSPLRCGTRTSRPCITSGFEKKLRPVLLRHGTLEGETLHDRVRRMGEIPDACVPTTPWSAGNETAACRSWIISIMATRAC